MTERKILWLKWVDPLAHMVYQEESESELLRRSAQDSFLGDDESKSSNDDGRAGAANVGPCIVGPCGIIPLNESNLPGKIFNFWVMHTNFDLSSITDDKTTSYAQLIAVTDGVETIDVFTRYRARIAIGRVFSQDDVKKRIEDAVSKQKLSKPVEKNDFWTIKKMLSKKYKHWIIYQTLDGNFEYIVAETTDEIETKRKDFLLSVNAQEVARSW